ncbi:MAG: radical SAM protein [Acidobacteria bacterium]|nr:radical SAM protein [Acidobacteriota bacterium]
MKRLKDLIFFVTRRCNLRCRTCFYAGEIDRDPAEAELTLAEIDKVAAGLPRLDSLLVSGGEPFLREDLVEICAIFQRRCRIAAIHLPSNGLLSERVLAGSAEILRRLPGLRLTLSLPLDGLESVHDGIKGAAGSFRGTIATARALAPLRKKFPALRVYIITVAARENLADVLPLAEWIRRDLDVDGHGPSPLRGRPRDPGLRPPRADEWRELAAALLPYHRHWLERSGRSRLHNALAFHRVRYLYGLYARVLAGGGLPFACPAGERIAVLEPDGGVRLCELSPVVGNVRAAAYDLRAILRGPEAERELRARRSCSCTHACFLERGIRSSPGALARSLLGRREPLHG